MHRTLCVLVMLYRCESNSERIVFIPLTIASTSASQSVRGQYDFDARWVIVYGEKMCSGKSISPDAKEKYGSRSRPKANLVKSVIYFVHQLFDFLVDSVLGFYHRNGKKTVPPLSNKLLLQSATQLAQNIRTGKLTSVEVVQACIDRINAVNGLVNAMVDNRFEDALKDAQQIDEDIKNGKINEETFKEKPFLGVPFTTKESTHCKGMSLTFGLRNRLNEKAKDDADVVKNMKASGGILLGCTNVPQVNLWWETHNPIFGITANPYDVTRSAGGSSGGEAALIASCASPIGIGTDIGGSIRIPSYMCGLFGHKCSPKLTPTKGLTYRTGEEAESSMVVAGPIARSADDLIPGLKAILGPSYKNLELDTPVDVTKLKYYYCVDSGELACSPVDSDVRAAMDRAINHLSSIADNVTPLEIKEFQSSANIYRHWLSLEGNFSHDITGRTGKAVWYKELAKFILRLGQYSFAVIIVLISTQLLPNASKESLEDSTYRLKTKLLDTLGKDGVLLYTSMPTPAHHHHASYFRPLNFSYMSIFSVLKLPVTQVPLGLTSSGLPVGVQVVAATNMDHVTIAVAKELERGLGGYVPPFETD